MNSGSDTAHSQTAPQSKASWIDVLLLAGIFAVMIWGVGDYGLYEPHEGHFAGVGREMVTSGDWILPNLNGAPYLNKPPLFYWMIATSYSIFGISEWAARLPLVLVGWCGVLLAWQWTRELFGIRAGRYAAIMLAIATGWYLFCHQLLIDALLSVLNLAALYVLWKAIESRTRTWLWLAFYAIVGLSVMAKGLIGIAFPIAALLCFIVWYRDKALLRTCRPILGILVMVAVVGPWVLLLERRNPGTLWYMIKSEHIDRAFDRRWPPDYSVVKVNWWKYLVITAVWLAPWSLLLPQVVGFCRKIVSRAAPQSPFRDAVALLVFGALLPVVAFLPMPSRLIYYSLPCVLPFVILTAGWWAQSDQFQSNRSRVSAFLTLCGIGAVIVGVSFFLGGWLKAIPDLASSPGELVLIPRVALLMGSALLIGGGLLMNRRPTAAIAVIGLLFATADIMNVSGFADYDHVLSSKKLVNSIRDKVGTDCIWVSEGSKEIGASAGIAYYLGRESNGRARSVYVMTDDSRRPPPRFPGDPLNYLIDQKRLEELWNGSKPVVFITDFQRSDWLADPPHLPIEARDCIANPPVTGNRRIYANAAAWERLQSDVSAGQ